ncbi:putative transmembrane protein [Variovorax paradoxus B4]|uniref:Putative transmembrane protein n=1 Tax=Variovorax paradoxus B4 TaxID=1246301 RepID=T1X518_VARPD|nr:CopD family protein [Variovorax paradoxus]AGU47260.1 putative transmembrane protein [Variovorax paradoxus B4]
MSYVILLLIHLLAAAFWVGGMATLHFAVRPAAVATLEPPLRLRTMAAALRRFFVGVDAAVTLLFVTGVAMILLAGGFRAVHWRVEAMMGIAIVMAGIYVYIRASVFRALRRAVEESAWPVAAARLNTVRLLVTVNLALGVAVFAVATVGRAG